MMRSGRAATTKLLRGQVAPAVSDLTIGELRRSRTMLEYVCGRCGAARLFDPVGLPFGPLQPVATAHRRMRCGTCGHDGASSYSRPAWVGAAARLSPA
jgi:DNA-directed RNA polymerase subunit RPC12/RpoP